MVNLAYYGLPSLPTERASDVASLSGSEGDLGIVARPSVGRARFEFILPLLKGAGVALSGLEVSVIYWAAWAALALACKSSQPPTSVRVLGENSGTSGLKTIWYVAL